MRTPLRTLLYASALATIAVPAIAQTTVPVVTYNLGNTHPSAAVLVAEIQALSPQAPIVALQEVNESAIQGYANQLGIAYGGTWTWDYQGHNCKYNAACYPAGGAYNPANDTSGEGVAVLTRLSATFHPHVFMTKDRWWLGRAAVAAVVSVPGYGTITAVAGHAPVGPDVTGVETRDDYTSEIKAWADGFGHPVIIGADFNFNHTQTTLYNNLTAGGWIDAWVDYTGAPTGGATRNTRIDYWVAHPTGGTIEATFAQVGPQGVSDHKPLYVEYQLGGGAPTGWTISDPFNDGSINTSIWNLNNVFTGSETTAVVISETTRLEMALVNNGASSQYNGISTKVAKDFTNASMSVELVQPPNAAALDAYAMIAVGTSSSAFYRIFVAGGQLVVEKNVGAGKVRPISPIAYSNTTHRYLRIKHSGGNVVFETCPATCTPTSWQPQHSETWSASVPTTLFMELKGGTDPGQSNPGTIWWANFFAQKP